MQTNITIWPDGREWRMDCPARYRDGRIWFDDALITGHVGDMPRKLMRHTVFGTWESPNPPGTVQLEPPAPPAPPPR